MGLGLEGVKQLDDVPVMHEFLQNLNFLHDFALTLSLRVDVLLEQRFDCNEVTCQDVLGQVNHTKRALAKLVADPVELLACCDSLVQLREARVDHRHQVPLFLDKRVIHERVKLRCVRALSLLWLLEFQVFYACIELADRSSVYVIHLELFPSLLAARHLSTRILDLGIDFSLLDQFDLVLLLAQELVKCIHQQHLLIVGLVSLRPVNVHHRILARVLLRRFVPAILPLWRRNIFNLNYGVFLNVHVQHQECWVLDRARLQLVSIRTVLVRSEADDLVLLADSQVVHFDF